MMRYFVAALMLLLAAPAGAEEVQIRHEGARLNGELALAAGKTLADGVVLLTHGTLLHGGAELMRALQDGLEERGLSSLAITLSLGQDDRRGAFDCAAPHRHLHGDAVGEIAAWVSWLRAEGSARIVLAGHSRGGAQTALYLGSSRADPAVAGAVLVAPALFERAKVEADYARSHGAKLAPLVEKARAMVAAGRGAEPLGPVGFLYCPEADASAAAFLDYYGDAPQKDTPTLLAAVAKPILVVTGSRDQVFPDLAERLAPLAAQKNVRVSTIAEADHFFQDLYADEVAEQAAAFIGAL
jgi:pimeloyl-ACP methyl ester carboxylesterase